MGLFLANLAMSSYFLALCYVLASFVTFSKYFEIRRFLHKVQRTGWSTTQLLVLSIALGCLFRTITFSTLCFFDSQHTLPPASSNIINGGDNGNDLRYIGNGLLRQKDLDRDARDANTQRDLNFYNKVVAVLFNLPDYLFVSSYLLLVLVWAEAFQSSRRHWFSAEEFRRRWMIFYLIFNGLLYMTQLILYTLMFLYDPNGIFEDEKEKRLSPIPAMIFYVVAAVDLLLPLIILVTWFYLTLSLSGFPFKSSAAKFRLVRVGRLAMAWSLGRILYSVITLLTFTRGWFNVERGNETAQSMLLVSVFFAAELVPIYWTLDVRLLTMLSVEDYHALPAASRTFMAETYQ